MKKLNQTYIDSLINKVINETLEEKANKLVSKIKNKIPTDDEVDEMMSSEVNEKMETCKQCGGETKEGETCEQCRSKRMYEEEMGDLKNAPAEFDYVAEDKEEISMEDNLEIMSADGDGDPLDRVNRFCSKDSGEYNEEACRYHKKLEMSEELHGKQHKIDVAEPKGKITGADFKKLRSMKKKGMGENYGMEDEMGGGYYKYDNPNRHKAAKLANRFPGVTFSDDDLNKSEDELSVDYEKIMGKRKKFDIDDPNFRTPAGFRAGEMVSEEGETEEGNAFTAKLKQTPKGGTFELGGKKYKDTSNLGEGKKFIQKATEKIEKKGTEGKFGSWCKRNGLASEEGEVTKKCIDKAMKSDNPSVVKMANFAKNIKGYAGSEHKKKSVKLKESEMIKLIEKIIMEEQKSNIKLGTAKGLEKYKQVHAKDGKENSDALKATAKKMKEYLKDGSKGEYKENPDFFPKGNGELAKMSKKAYVPSGAVQDYIDNFTAAGLENLDYDGISPNEDWVTDNIEGSSRTGNNPEWANTGKSDVNKKRNKIRKDNLLAKIKRKAYNKAPQPIVNDKTGEDEGDKIMTKLESIDPKKTQKINEEFDRMKSLMGYNQKTQ